MNHNTIFTVKNSDLDRLNPHTAVDFFRKLLWAEARRIGVEISKINVSSAIHVADGGIDAVVDDANIETGLGIIKPGKTSYQIKSGATEPWQPAVIKKILFGEKPPDKQNLGRSIHACLHPDVNGTYILVCTGIDCLVETRRTEALLLIKEHFAACGYPNAEVEIWTQNTLIGYLESFPSLALWVNGNDRGIFQSHRSWSGDADMDVQFVPGQTQTKLIANIQAQLRSNVNTVHLPVLGEPGIGKTKLALEATKTEDLSPLVIYCTAAQFRESNLMNYLLREDNCFSAILVLDECDPDSRSYIWNKLKNHGPKLKLITLYNDYEEIPTDIAFYDVKPLEKEHIQDILQEYGVPEDQTSRWAELCSGSPRVAHVIGENLSNNPDDLLKPLSTVNIWERYVVGTSNPDCQEVKERKRILRYIALFKKFGFEKSVKRDSQAIAKKITDANSEISETRFREVVRDLKRRKILQGDSTLYITPKALHIKLWTEWWDYHGDTFDFDEFIRGFPPESKLVDWFCDMFQYTAESGAASRVVEDLLGPMGHFRNGEYLKARLGSHFFLALSEGAPESALECLIKTVGTWDKQALLQFREGRRNVVWALQKIAVWRDLFADAARLLLALAEAENEGFSNNSCGVFAELFSLGPGRVAPTEAPLPGRLPIVEEAFASGSKEKRALALRACNVALESTHFSRIGNPEYQGIRRQPELWMPKTYGELWAAYKEVWKLLEDQLARLPEDESGECAMVLLERAREITRIPNLAEMVAKTVTTIAEEKYVNEKHAIETINQILHYDGDDISTETRELWKQLMDKLVKSDFHSMMNRYVAMDFVEDEFDKDGNQVDGAQPHIEELAKRSLDDLNLLKSELDWLVTAEAQKGYHFGHELGKLDDELSLSSVLLDAQRNAGENASTAFLGGYFGALFESDIGRWETQLDALIDDTKLRLLIPELTNRSGITDRAGSRILHLAENSIINFNHFRCFAYGQAIRNLSNETFAGWVTFLLGVDDKNSVSLALNLFQRYHVFQKTNPTLPFDLTFRLITHPALFKQTDGPRFDSTMTAYHWAKIARTFLQLHPEKNLELADLMLSHFAEDGSIVSPYSQTCSVLDEITEKYPVEIWEKVSRFLENHEYSSKKFYLEQWLREGSSWGREETRPALLQVPHEPIWDWIGEDLEYRAWYFANRLVPKALSTAEWEGSLVRGLLIHYGERADVRSNLCANYMTETYWGPASLHYEGKIRKLLNIKNKEDDRNAIRWIDEFVRELKGCIEQAEIEEERSF